MTPQIIAHRGASYLAPENTLIAFKKAMELGADGVEMDVQQTSDAGLVIHHDYMIDLHTDISGKIYDMTMGDLKTLDFGSWKDVLFKDSASDNRKAYNSHGTTIIQFECNDPRIPGHGDRLCFTAAACYQRLFCQNSEFIQL